MLLDGFLMFSNGQALTAVGTVDSANVLDMQNPRDLGIGEQKSLKIFVQTSTPLLSTGATTVIVNLQGSTDASTWTTMATSGSITKANLTAAGTRIWSVDMPRPVAGQALPRYYKLTYAIGTTDFTSGTINAGIVLDDQANVQYAAGMTFAN